MRVLQKAIVSFNTSLSLIQIRHRYNESRVKYIFVNGFKELLENHFFRNKENNNKLLKYNVLKVQWTICNYSLFNKRTVLIQSVVDSSTVKRAHNYKPSKISLPCTLKRMEC